MIKLDRSWIADIDQDPVRQALIYGLVGFSGAFGARIVAEGVERPEEADVLVELGVPLAQGYLFGEQLLSQRSADHDGRRSVPRSCPTMSPAPAPV